MLRPPHQPGPPSNMSREALGRLKLQLTHHGKSDIMKKILSAVGLALLVLLGVAPAAMAVPASEIVVADTAKALYQPQLMPALESIDFHDPTKLVVFTRAGTASENLNEEVLRYARENHPEWISSDGQKWADGLFIFALDTTGRKVGTYMGEDRKVSRSKQEAIQDAGKELFRDAQWTDGTIAGVKKGAKLINQPWYQSAAFIVTSAITGGLALIGVGVRATVRANNRKKAADHIKRGDTGFSSVSLTLPETELNAKTISPASSYGALVLEKYRNFSTLYGKATELNSRTHAFTAKDLSKGRNVKITAEYADLSEQLDTLDDVIADTNALLNRYNGWEKAWDRQSAPLAEDLAGLATLVSQPEARDVPTTMALESLRVELTQQLQILAADFQSQRITPDAALDGLKNMRSRLTEALSRHSDAMIAKYAKTSAEEKSMRKAMEASRLQEDYSRRGTIFGAVYGYNAFYSVHSFNSGYIAGQHSVDQSRAAASSSGSSSGYGSSGGSFSGSGSSSSF